MQTSNIQLGINPWDAGISQTGLSLTGGSDYILNFQASATATRTVDIKIGFDDGSNIYYDGGFVISSTAEDYTVMFTNVANTTNASVEFLIGLSDTDLIFDNIELKEIDCEVDPDVPTDPDGDCHESQQVVVNGMFDNGIAPFNSWGCICLLYTSPSPRDLSTSRMPSSA